MANPGNEADKQLFQSTSAAPAGWLNHISGIARLLELRGPDKHHGSLPRALLESSRYMLVSKTPASNDIVKVIHRLFR